MSDPTDQPQDLAFENKKLKEENARLAKKVKSLNDSNASWWNIRFYIGKKIGEVFLGWRLSDSIKRLVRELKDKNVKNETIGDVLTHILWRFTRVGVIAILLAIIPSAILIIQTKLLSNQNKLLNFQNERIEQQNHLIEAQRRSSYVFLLGNIMDGVNSELSKPENSKRNISSQLQGEIIALSNSLIPYKFMLDDSIIVRPLSPERGMLLVFLLEAAINKDDLSYIINNSTFDNAYIFDLKIANDTMDELHLSNAKIPKLTLSNSIINNFVCYNCELVTYEIFNLKSKYISISTTDTVDFIRIEKLESGSFTNTFPRVNIFSITDSKVKHMELVSMSIGYLGFSYLEIMHPEVKSKYIHRANIDFARIDFGSLNVVTNSNMSHVEIEGHVIWENKGANLINTFEITNSIIVGLNINASIDTLRLKNSIVLSKKTMNGALERQTTFDCTNLYLVNESAISTNLIDHSAKHGNASLNVYADTMKNDNNFSVLDTLRMLSETKEYFYILKSPTSLVK